jgi:uncharacterized protein YyaL (SSP411 family)
MERESFESREIAALLNRHFVPVKVDREERPDVDRVYMLFVQATTGGGGWPMSVFLTPDLKPFFGGTYFPPSDRYGRPGFETVLNYLANAWMGDRARILESGENVTRQLAQYARVEPGGNLLVEGQISESLFFAFRRSYDAERGGFGNAPKFPRPVTFHFLLRHYALTRNREALDMTLHTLRKMAQGGMHDQLGGGFHRYSVDADWFVPHFEKMLYDQAQLAIAYLESFQITRDEFFADVARRIFAYVLRDLTSPEGAFYSAEDADSVIDPANPHEKGEGAFYIWAYAELVHLLGEDAAASFARRYGATPRGNVLEDPHQEFTARNILFDAYPDEAPVTQAVRETLLAARNQRVRPHLDDKILAAWNGLMIAAFARGARILNEPAYLAAARRGMDFVLAKLAPEGGVLLRRYRDGEAAIPGFLDDYAFTVQALVDLYEAGGDTRDLDHASRLAHDLIDLFEDPAEGAFFSTTSAEPSLILRLKDDYDGAEPSGNSAAVCALLALHGYTQDARVHEAASRALRAFANRLTSQPITAPQLVTGLLAERTPHRQIVLAGPPDEAFEEEIRSRFHPFQTLIRLDASPEARAWFSERIPALAAMAAPEGKPTAYVCENFTCQLPAVTREDLAKLL